MRELKREDWPRALAALPEKALMDFIDGLPSSWTIQPKALPQAGLGMLKMKESTMGEAFYLGEFPLASCHLSITTEDGATAEGGSLVMDDQLETAQRLAICDAVLAEKLPGWEQVANLISQGELARQKISQERKALLARTRVDFSLLDDAGDNNAEY